MNPVFRFIPSSRVSYKDSKKDEADFCTSVKKNQLEKLKVYRFATINKVVKTDSLKSTSKNSSLKK